MPDDVGSEPELFGNAFESVKIEAVRPYIFEQLRDRNPRKRAFLTRTRIPGNDREEHLHSPAMEFLNHLSKCGNPAWEIAQQIELVPIVHAEIEVNVPDQHGINRTE